MKFSCFFAPVLALALFASPALAQNREWWKSTWPKPPPANPEATALPLIQVHGNKFVNAAGETILFRGLSVADPDLLDYQGHWNRQLFEQLKDMGVNIVRLPVHPAGWRTRTPTEYIKLLDQAASWGSQLGIYIIIDWHSIGNLETGLFQDPMYDTSLEETYRFWRTIAFHFGHHHTVAFFELFNEPTSFRGMLGRADWDKWRTINEDLITMIRSFGATNVPLVAGFDWAYNLGPIIEDPIRAEGIGYVTHPYPNKRNQPWEPKWEEDFGFAAHQYPVIATEIGFALKDGETVNDDHYGNRITRYLESHGMSWLGWVYDADWGPQLLKSWNNYELTSAGEFFKQALHRPAAEPHQHDEQRKAGDY